MSDTKKTNNKKEMNKLIPIVGIVVLVLLVIVGIVVIINGNDKKIPADTDKDKKEPEKTDNLPVVTEQDIVKAYGFSVKDAEALVKKEFYSDNWTFSTEVTQDYLYIELFHHND